MTVLRRLSLQTALDASVQAALDEAIELIESVASASVASAGGFRRHSALTRVDVANELARHAEEAGEQALDSETQDWLLSFVEPTGSPLHNRRPSSANASLSGSLSMPSRPPKLSRFKSSPPMLSPASGGDGRRDSQERPRSVLEGLGLDGFSAPAFAHASPISYAPVVALPTDAWAAAAAGLRASPLDWTYDVCELDVASNGHCLVALFLEIMERHTLLERLHADGLSISRPTLIAFLLVLEAEYGDNTYHNRKHGADVLLGMHRFLTETADGDSRPPSHTASFTGAQSAAADAPADAPATPVGAFTSPPASDTSRDDDRCWPLSALQCFAGLFGAAVHDFNHPGTNNAHEIKRDSSLALRYHDDSVLECHHLASTFTALLRPEHNFVATWPRSEYMEMRKLVVQLVLMTDLGKHFDFVSSLNASPEGCLCADAKPDISLALTVAIKGADLGHSLKPWPLHLQWSRSVTDEFFALGDLERAAGVPISALCDREKDVDLGKNQIGFLKFVCLPFYVAIERALPDALSAETISRLEANIDAWATYAIEEVVAVGAPAAALPPPPPATPPPPRATTPDLNA